MAPTRTAGFSLVELMIGLAIAALLVVLALPNYQVWIADSQIRNAAESIASGMRYAQSQAVARNSTIEFILDPTTGTGGWRARLRIDGTILQTAVFAEGARLTTMTVIPAGATKVTFNSLGFIDDPLRNNENADGTAIMTQIQITSATGVAGARDLNVLVGGGTAAAPDQAGRAGIKICDPKWPATDPKGCPA